MRKIHYSYQKLTVELFFVLLQSSMNLFDIDLSFKCLKNPFVFDQNNVQISSDLFNTKKLYLCYLNLKTNIIILQCNYIHLLLFSSTFFLLLEKWHASAQNCTKLLIISICCALTRNRNSIVCFDYSM